MSEAKEVKRSIINRDTLHSDWPTHLHSGEFWQSLGRAVATFGFLEEVLGKAIFALTATKTYPPNEIDKAYEEWLPKLERALSDPLGNLIDCYSKAANENDDFSTDNIEDLVADLRRGSKIRNAICHGSWRAPTENGKSVPFYVNRQNEIFCTEIDIDYLVTLRFHTMELAVSVIDTITHMGWKFPGGGGLGVPIIEPNDMRNSN